METKKYYGVKNEKEFPSYMAEFFKAYPEKFEDRKNVLKPAVYGLLAVVCVFIVIFPQVIPCCPCGSLGWQLLLVCFLRHRGMDGSSDTYNIESRGMVKSIGIKKFIRSETSVDKIVEAFNRHDFKYLTALPSGNNQPVQLQVYEDAKGREMYCILTTYESNSNIVGLAEPVILKGYEYDDNVDFIHHMCDNEE